MIQINARQIFTPDRLAVNPIINIKHGKILGFGEDAVSDSLTIFDLPDYDLVPGFVELQINGAFGVDFTQDPTKVWQVGRRLTELGITIFLPTIITSPLDSVQHAIRTWKDSASTGIILGLLFPVFIWKVLLLMRKKGCPSPEFIRKPTMEDISEWKPENGIRLVTLAPEIPGALEIIALLSAKKNYGQCGSFHGHPRTN